jgi:hypothetical protein
MTEDTIVGFYTHPIVILGIIIFFIFVLYFHPERIDKLRDKKRAMRQFEHAKPKLASISKIELNSAIVKLIESKGEDQEASKLVSLLAATVPISEFNREQVNKGKKHLYSGFTKEAGDVSLSDSTPDQFKTSVHYERVGQFKLWRFNTWLIHIDFYQDASALLRSDYLSSDDGWALSITDTFELESFYQGFREFSAPIVTLFGEEKYQFKIFLIGLYGKHKGERIRSGSGNLIVKKGT